MLTRLENCLPKNYVGLLRIVAAALNYLVNNTEADVEIPTQEAKG